MLNQPRIIALKYITITPNKIKTTNNRNGVGRGGTIHNTGSTAVDEN